MTVVVLTACPERLRGVLTRWLLEISAGVYIGHIPARVRDHLWDRIVEDIGRGRAIMVHTKKNEQRFDFRVHGHHWEPTDYDGLKLMKRPTTSGHERIGANQPTQGWSHAGRRNKPHTKPTNS